MCVCVWWREYVCVRWREWRLLTCVVLLPEELLAVIGRVRLLHLGQGAWHLPAQRRREEGRTVALWGRGRAERRHLCGRRGGGVKQQMMSCVY